MQVQSHMYLRHIRGDKGKKEKRGHTKDNGRVKERRETGMEDVAWGWERREERKEEEGENKVKDRGNEKREGVKEKGRKGGRTELESWEGRKGIG